MRNHRHDVYHAGKIFELTDTAVKSMAINGAQLSTRLIWGSKSIPNIEFYLSQLDMVLQRPSVLLKHQVDLVDMAKRFPYGSEHWKLSKLHWREMHQLGSQLLDWFHAAESIAYEAQTRRSVA
ncbi:MAG: hypothetical protein ACK4M6_15100 [Hyphomonas sp.]